MLRAYPICSPEKLSTSKPSREEGSIFNVNASGRNCCTSVKLIGLVRVRETWKWCEWIIQMIKHKTPARYPRRSQAFLCHDLDRVAAPSIFISPVESALHPQRRCPKHLSLSRELDRYALNQNGISRAKRRQCLSLVF